MSKINSSADIQERAQKIYDYSWQTKAKFAESGREVSADVISRQNNEIEGLAVVSMQLAGLLEHALQRIDSLEHELEKGRGRKHNNQNQRQGN